MLQTQRVASEARQEALAYAEWQEEEVGARDPYSRVQLHLDKCQRTGTSHLPAFPYAKKSSLRSSSSAPKGKRSRARESMQVPGRRTYPDTHIYAEIDGSC